jgi:hypothetical protein
MVIGPAGCQPERPGERPDTSRLTATSSAADSTYRAQLVAWRRDSAVLDSLTRIVNTDALYRLYRHALLPTGVTLPLMNAIACEELRLGVQYGAVASDRAINRMLDTVYRDIGVNDGLEYLARHAPREGQIETGYDRCKPMPPAVPRTIGSTRTDVELPRPRSPRPAKAR